MLARLDEDLAPYRASADRSGSFLRLDGPRDDSAIRERTMAVLDEMAYLAEEVGEPPAVARWFGTGAIEDLSREEADVLAGRWVDEMSAEGLISSPGRLLEPLRRWLFDAFRTAARTGDVGIIRVEPATIRTVLDEAEAESVGRWLNARLGHAHPD